MMDTLTKINLIRDDARMRSKHLFMLMKSCKTTKQLASFFDYINVQTKLIQWKIENYRPFVLSHNYSYYDKETNAVLDLFKNTAYKEYTRLCSELKHPTNKKKQKHK